MKKLGSISLFVLFVFMGACAVKPVVQTQAIQQNSEMETEVRAVLAHGDWLVIRGLTGPDNLIATVTNSPLSHAAIYDINNDEVIEADHKGVHTTPLPKFLDKAQRLLIIRPIWAMQPDNGQANAANAVKLARSWLGKPYNYTGLAGLNLPDRYYCTQLALMAYKPAMQEKPNNPIPLIIEPGQMYHWGRIVYDSGP